ncbi:type II toxin-antitoxin system VapC family toxin [Mucilaginibacter sp. AK015]|uniref:type II toxin-antitoxin system VapC family toxin n=1 Tax=Mucilaginibacter sp. AK015 TaxID=2723072 RepID=UPI0016202809|nr:type II toxin-antitoxin system VapC family toxin [Mucilaginibacter sp. AK015]MBB5397365.1 PIN domain nuclease of toxin-antitoxin system [Mucilaginibacter sp. AK015]
MALNKYLLDTHCLIWFQKNNPQLSKHALSIIEDPDNIILFSQVSLFELVIKQTLGKIPEFIVSTEDVYSQGKTDGFIFEPIQNNHIQRYSEVPLFDNHRDPFDRLLIATAMEENAVIISGDEKFTLYKDMIRLIW